MSSFFAENRCPGRVFLKNSGTDFLNPSLCKPSFMKSRKLSTGTIWAQLILAPPILGLAHFGACPNLSPAQRRPSPNLGLAFGPWPNLGPGPILTQPNLGSAAIWVRPKFQIGPSPIWARPKSCPSQFGPRPIWDCPIWVWPKLGPAPIGPGPICARPQLGRARIGPGPNLAECLN